MASVPFEALVKAQQSLLPEPLHRVNLKRKRDDKAGAIKNHDTKPHRERKSAPMETSSKKPVSRAREVVEVPKIERRDPRFDPEEDAPLKEKITQRRYAFLQNYRDDEMKLLRSQIPKEKDPIARAKLEKTLSSMQSKEQASRERERRQRVLTEFKQKEKAAAKAGKIPYHLKESAKNELYLKDKYDSMKSSKAVDKYLEKKRKRRSQKDRKMALPAR